MGITASIVSAVLKSVVGDKLGSGLVKELTGISIDGISEKGINEITNFINREKSKIESIFSKENMKSMNILEDHIDYVVIEIKDLLSKITITDEVLRQCKYNSLNIKEFMWNEYIAHKIGYIEYESEIKRCLLAVAEALIELVRESEKFSENMLIQISNSIDDTKVGLQNISEYLKENFGKLDVNNQMVLNILLTILEEIQKVNLKDNEIKGTTDEEKMFQNNKKQKYIENWNSRLFLHMDSEEPVTLEDAFIMPDYKILKSNRYINFFVEDSLDEIIEKFVKYNKSSTMLITGVPGIGKSSITSWISNKYMQDDSCIVLRFRDWESEELEKGILKSIYNTLKCRKKDLENKVVILDGYDEMKSLNIQYRLLTNYFSDIKDFENFKCIITSRPAYINSDMFENILILKEFDITRIDKFYRKITGKVLENKEKIKTNLEVLGIPVILYMAVMSNIDISENPTKPELYNRIFAEKGGIFDKFYDGQVEYGKGNQIMRMPPNIKKYLKFLRETAFKMYESDKLSLLIDECNIPDLEFEEKSVSILEFPIKHLFEKNKFDIEFIHKSIYEYFTSEYIFMSITHKNNIYDLAGTLGKLLITNKLSYEILEFLKYKVQCHTNNQLSDTIYGAFRIMLRDGMTFYTNKCYKNVITCEFMILSNMLEIIHLWDNKNLKFDDIYKYIELGKGIDLNLSGMDLRKIDWGNIDFTNTKIKNLNLGGVNLEKLNLKGARFKEADLTEADFSGAKLFGAKFIGSKLVGADLTDAKLNEADLTRADFTRANFTDADFTRIKY